MCRPLWCLKCWTLSVAACLLLICVNVHNAWLRLCVCRCERSPISSFSLVVSVSVRLCGCVVAEAAVVVGLMGSVGAWVPGEQLSLIIQTRLIIKAAQISPWFHLNCRQAAPLRQAVVTLGWLALSFSSPLQGRHALLRSAPSSVLTSVTARRPLASQRHVNLHSNKATYYECAVFNL